VSEPVEDVASYRFFGNRANTVLFGFPTKLFMVKELELKEAAKKYAEQEAHEDEDHSLSAVEKNVILEGHG
jgi:hypothetical protein